MHYHYTTVGHVTVDVLDDGVRRAGGTAFYSALQAARLGLRALIVTRGRRDEIEPLLAPYSHELDVRVHAAEHTTTLLTRGSGSDRRQRLRAWAGPIADPLELDTDILHLAPVARETPSSWRGAAAFVGLTPQGLARGWSHDGDPAAPAPVVSVPVDRAAVAVAARCHAIVLSHVERASCAAAIDAARHAGAVVAVTAGAHPTELLLPGQPPLELDVPTLDSPVDDLGAGDVFAAAFFIALSERHDPGHAARFANAAAAVRMRAPGPGAIGTRALVERQLSRS